VVGDPAPHSSAAVPDAEEEESVISWQSADFV
jgi:hypothetical protein